MQEAIERIRRYTSGIDEDQFSDNAEKVDAVLWNLIVLGEAARQVPDAVVHAYPEVPWPQIRGIRNRVVHGYDQIDVGIIWNVVHGELDPLEVQLQRVMLEASD